MLEFIRMLLFGKLVLLTPIPFDIQSEYQLALVEPISAVTDGATLEIDVSATVSPKLGPFDAPNAALAAFPKGSVTAKLSQTHGTVVVEMIYSGYTAESKDEVHLLLKSIKPIPTNVEFDRVEIKTEKFLPQVRIYWKNVQSS